MSASACACIAFNFKKKYKKKTNRWGFYTKLKLFLNAKKIPHPQGDYFKQKYQMKKAIAAA